MPHALLTCGRVGVSLAFAAIVSMAATCDLAQAGSANATLSVSVVVSPSCTIGSRAEGYTLACGGGAERTSRISVEGSLAAEPVDAWGYSRARRVAPPNAILSRDVRRVAASSTWAPRQRDASDTPRPRPPVLVVNF